MSTQVPPGSSVNLDRPLTAPVPPTARPLPAAAGIPQAAPRTAAPMAAPVMPTAAPMPVAGALMPVAGAPMPAAAIPGAPVPSALPVAGALMPAAAPPSQSPPQKTPAAPAPADEDSDSGVDWSVMIPSVLTSTVFHIAIVLTLALIGEPVEKKQEQTITSIQAPEPELVEDFKNEDPLPEQPNPDNEMLNLDASVNMENADTSMELPDTRDFSMAVDATADSQVATTEDFLAPSGDYSAVLGKSGNVGKGDALVGRRSGRAGKAKAGGGGSETEAAVERALKWIASVQAKDGGWNFDLKAAGSAATQSGEAEVARNGATGLALLPFLAAGYTHKEKSQYQQVVYRGLDYLSQHPTKKYTNLAKQTVSWHEPSGTMYSHGICAMAMCEAYGMTKDKSLMPYAQGGMNFISDAQDPAKGGWRYDYRQAGDTSVVGWQLMALKSGAMAYLTVNPNTIKQATVFLNSVSDEKDNRAFYGYTTPGRGPATTAIGLIARLHLGWKKDNEGLVKGVGYLGGMGPSPTNYYFNYYATQVMFQYDGDEWTKWNDKMKAQLLKNQSTKGADAGSWHPADYVNNYRPDHSTGRGGRLYTTSLGCMILEVYYRYSKVLSKDAVDESFPL